MCLNGGPSARSQPPAGHNWLPDTLGCPRWIHYMKYINIMIVGHHVWHGLELKWEQAHKFLAVFVVAWYESLCFSIWHYWGKLPLSYYDIPKTLILQNVKLFLYKSGLFLYSQLTFYPTAHLLEIWLLTQSFVVLPELRVWTMTGVILWMEHMPMLPYFVLPSFEWCFCFLELLHIFEGHRCGDFCNPYLHYRVFFCVI